MAAQAVQELKDLDVVRFCLVLGQRTQEIEFVEAEQRAMPQAGQVCQRQPQRQPAVFDAPTVGHQLMPERRRALAVQKVAEGKKQALQLIVEGRAEGVPEDGRRNPVVRQRRGQGGLADPARAGEADRLARFEVVQRLLLKLLAADQRGRGDGLLWAHSRPQLLQQQRAQATDRVAQVAVMRRPRDVQDVVVDRGLVARHGPVALPEVVKFQDQAVVASALLLLAQRFVQHGVAVVRQWTAPHGHETAVDGGAKGRAARRRSRIDAA